MCNRRKITENKAKWPLHFTVIDSWGMHLDVKSVYYHFGGLIHQSLLYYKTSARKILFIFYLSGDYRIKKMKQWIVPTPVATILDI